VLGEGGGDYDRRTLGVPPQARQDLPAGERWDVDVEDDQAGTPRADSLDGVGAVRDEGQLEVLEVEGAAVEGAQHVVVLHHEDASGFGQA
jgi:hypothetical protein